MALQKHFDAVYDVTVLYSQAFERHVDGPIEKRTAPSMNGQFMNILTIILQCTDNIIPTDYLHGFDQQLHVIVKRTDLKDLPTEEKATQRWLHQSFQEKDRYAFLVNKVKFSCHSSMFV